ncbi:uncharacterized protein LOC115227077 [Octopus sinensis]|uniref:Uncharacterized protein LOC115227077 n=1 Tax=Octopus sinensis TaxID=2607531 RepID=A0A6P7TVC4_9MOLL|nr:uncharacterized protein LOC115227077 [Octopus sinensis]
MDKFSLFRHKSCRELCQFPNLAQLENNHEADISISDDDLFIYCDHLKSLHNDMSCRCQDLISMEIPDWLINPFIDDYTNEADSEIQEELITLQNDFELNPLFKNSYQEFWLQKEISESYLKLWEATKHFFVAFLTTYMAAWSQSND